MWSEIKILDKYDHPNIVRVLDFCEDQDNVYIVFELMLNGSLTENMKKIK